MPYRAQRFPKKPVRKNEKNSDAKPVVSIVMGSTSDAETMEGARTVMKDFGIPHEVRVVSAHRTPDYMMSFATQLVRRGIKVVIAGAGGAAHLPGMIAAKSIIPVIGVPVQSRALKGLDSLLSIAQMPSGVPVATVAIGNSTNAGLLAVRILATNDKALRVKLEASIERMKRKVLSSRV